ncbi:hypothetical protein KSS87_009002, partial [Heliosperma pusillum]
MYNLIDREPCRLGLLGTTDVVERGTGCVVFRTCPEERHRVVFQMGTSDAVRALKAAELVCNDVAAVDINMGCPKSFSVSGGMGAALLSKPEIIHDILTTLKRNLNTPVTCKIRLLNTSSETVELARRIEKMGVSALGVHGRKVQDRPRDPAKWNEIADVVSAISIPVIGNGDVFDYEDFLSIKLATGAASVMVARGALWNASIFSPLGKLPWEEVKKVYVKKSILWDNDIKSTKHTLKEMIMHHSGLGLPEGKAVIKSENLEHLATAILPAVCVFDGLENLKYSTKQDLLKLKQRTGAFLVEVVLFDGLCGRMHSEFQPL